MNLLDTISATSSPASVSGHTPCGSRAGPTTNPSGRDRVPANLSARQAKEQGSLTSGTYGPRGFTSSSSDDLAWSLVSRLRERTALLGSTLYALTWKRQSTPLGRSIYRLAASGHRTRGTGCTSWGTPRSTDGSHGGPNQDDPSALTPQAHLASWATPKAQTGKYQYAGGDKNRPVLNLEGQVCLASWPTTRANDGTGDKVPPGRMGAPALKTVASWAMPTQRDHKDGACNLDNVPVNALLGREALLTASGPPPFSGLARMVNQGLSLHEIINLRGAMEQMMGRGYKTGRMSLNPRFSLWLMGLPTAWDDCAPTETPSSLRKRQSS